MAGTHIHSAVHGGGGGGGDGGSAVPKRERVASHTKQSSSKMSWLARRPPRLPLRPREGGVGGWGRGGEGRGGVQNSSTSRTCPTFICSRQISSSGTKAIILCICRNMTYRGFSSPSLFPRASFIWLVFTPPPPPPPPPSAGGRDSSARAGKNSPSSCCCCPTRSPGLEEERRRRTALIALAFLDSEKEEV